MIAVLDGVENIWGEGENAGQELFRLSTIFSSAVFGENPRHCYSFSFVVVVVVHFFITEQICLKLEITEQIYMKLEIYVHYEKRNTVNRTKV